MFNFITLIVVIVGAVNWFCIGVFQFDIIAGIFGTQAHFASRFIYTVIGLAGFWLLAYTLIKKGQLSLLPPKKKKVKIDKKKNTSDTTTGTQNNSSLSPTTESQYNQDTEQSLNQALNTNKQIDTIILTNSDSVSSTSPPSASQTDIT